jgi:hypothetical protein
MCSSHHINHICNQATMLHICNQATREHPSHYNYNASSILQRTHHICSQATREHPSHRQSAQHILHFDQSVWLSAVTDRKLQVKQSIVTQNASRNSTPKQPKTTVWRAKLMLRDSLRLRVLFRLPCSMCQLGPHPQP